MQTVLHVLPHRGGGGERYVDLLESMDGYAHDRTWLSARRTPLAGAPSIAIRRPAIARAARAHDLVHLHGDMASMLSLSLARRRPAVISTHGLSFLRRAQGLPVRVARARWQRVALAARAVICSSHAEYGELVELSAPGARDRLTVIANGIPLPPATSQSERAAARAALGVGDDVTVCLYLGMLDRYKDPITAVRATEIARGRGARLELLVAGDGPLLDQVRAQAGPGVRVLGFSEPEPLLHAADLLVMPSRREGSSYALLEAMAHGLAVVASDGAGVGEMVADAGVTAPAGDAEAFARALGELASDPRRRSQLGSAARTRVAEHYELTRFVAEVRDVYGAALAEPGPGSPSPTGSPE